MKKMLVIIFILLIIFIGIYINKKNIGNDIVTATEVNNIEEYISKIYMWQEITEEALPKFNNINDAPDLWLWEVVKKNLDDYEVSYDETKNGYEVEIAEYLEDYENSMNIEDENQVYDIYIKDLNHNIIATIKSNDGETKSIEVVKENIDKFTTKKIILEKDKNENLYVRQVG